MSVKIDAGQLSAAILAQLSAFAGATDEVVDHAAKVAGEHAVAELNINSPARSGDYRKDWAVKIGKRARVGGTAQVIVHNRSHYRLSHLLENGHVKVVYGHRLPGTVAPRPHIRAVEQAAVQEFEALVKQGVSKL